MTQSLTGKLLVASPLLTDPNFARTVVYLCAHDASGAFGLVLNRPLRDRVEQHLPRWLEIVTFPSVLFAGGPMEPTAAFGLARRRTASTPSEGWMDVDGAIGLVDLTAGPGSLAPELAQLRLFSGYAGWAPGQLDEEVEANGWFVVPALAADLFLSEPGDLWRTVLRRQPGEVAMFAFYPQDPSVN